MSKAQRDIIKENNLIIFLKSVRRSLEIPGFDNYLISDCGRIFTKKRGIERKLTTDRHGYKLISLGRDGKVYQFKVHRLVLMTYSKLKNGLEVNHKNSIPSDNRIENLEACTHSENMKHANTYGRKRSGFQKKQKKRSPNRKSA